MKLEYHTGKPVARNSSARNSRAANRNESVLNALPRFPDFHNPSLKSRNSTSTNFSQKSQP